jgi:hypothetical protein
MIRKHIVALNVLGLIAAGLAVGCAEDPKPAYGTRTIGSSGSDSSAMSMTPPPTVVPAGALPLSTGTYNQIQFTVPRDSGVIYLYDQDTNKVVGMTNSVASNYGQSMTMVDLKNTSQGLNQTDHYRVYFAPSTPTTKPIGG